MWSLRWAGVHTPSTAAPSHRAPPIPQGCICGHHFAKVQCVPESSVEKHAPLTAWVGPVADPCSKLRGEDSGRVLADSLARGQNLREAPFGGGGSTSLCRLAACLGFASRLRDDPAQCFGLLHCCTLTQSPPTPQGCGHHLAKDTLPRGDPFCSKLGSLQY